MKKLLILLFALFILHSCQSKLQVFSSLDEIKVNLVDQTSDVIRFEILNNSEFDVNVESTWHLFIEHLSNQSWERVAFVPCICGTPCIEPRPVKLAPGDTQMIEWKLISRGCKTDATGGLETLEKKVESGVYRIKFTLNPSKSGVRLNPENLQVEFKVK